MNLFMFRRLEYRIDLLVECALMIDIYIILNIHVALV